MVAPEPPCKSLVTARELLLPQWGLCQKERGTGAQISVSPDREGDRGHPLFLVLWTSIPWRSLTWGWAKVPWLLAQGWGAEQGPLCHPAPRGAACVIPGWLRVARSNSTAQPGLSTSSGSCWEVS